MAETNPTVNPPVETQPIPQPAPTSVIVKNLDKTFEIEKTLSDFFSFCGEIQSISITVDSQDPTTCSAVLKFPEPEMAKTAVLLNNTQINDRFITVEPFSSDAPMPEANTVYAMFDTAAEGLKSIDENLHLTETIGSVVNTVDTKLTEINEEYKIGETLQSVGDGIKEKAQDIDNQYLISAKTAALGESIKTSFVQFEQDHQIVENTEAIVNNVATTVSTGVQSGVASVTEFLNTNETAKTGMEFVSDIGESIGGALNGFWSSIITPTAPETTGTNGAPK